MHSSLSHPHDHAAGVALQHVLPHLSGIPFLQPVSLLSSYLYVRMHEFTVTTKPHEPFLSPLRCFYPTLSEAIMG